MTRALARELGNDNITVNAISPGYSLTEGNLANNAFAAAHRAAEIASRALPHDAYSEDLVGAVSFLASDDAAFIAEQILAVDPAAGHHFPKMHAGLHFTPVAMAVFTGRSGRFFHRSSEDLSTAGQGDHPKLLHNRVKVRDTPMLDDLAVADTHCVDCLEAHPPVPGTPRLINEQMSASRG